MMGTWLKRYWRDLVYPLMGAVAAWLMAGVIFMMGAIASGSMEPTLMTGELFLANRLIDVQDLERGDIVFFHYGDVIYCKRIIGLPGETVSLWDGYVYIDDVLYDESAYLADSVITGASVAGNIYTVPADCYFMMGDNRSNSYDGRFWEDAYIHGDAIVACEIASVDVPVIRWIWSIMG